MSQPLGAREAGLMNLTTRAAALAAPLLMLGYGVCRVLDGRDGDHGPGVEWNIGHSLFLAAFVAFGTLIVALRLGVRAPSTRRAVFANMATGLGLVGVLAFVRVILGDLFPDADDVLPLPGVLEAVGPLLFLFGLLGLLVDVAIHEPHRLPAWTPPVVLLGFVAVTVDLDLLPVAATLFLAGLAPLVLTSTVRGAGEP